MRKREGTAPGRRQVKGPRPDAVSELPMVAVLLVAAILVAAYAAGGPVLAVLMG